MNIPIEILRLRRLSLISLCFFGVFQIFGLFILLGDLQYLAKSFDLNSIDTLSLDSSLLTFRSHSSIQNFLSGASISMTSGFWLTVSWAAIRLKKPYSHKALQVLRISFYLQIAFFALSFNSVIQGHKGIINPGTLGSAITFAFTVPIFLQSRNGVVRLWSQEFLPPPPVINPS